MSPLDSKKIQPVNPKEISPEYLLEGLMLKLKRQYFGHLMGRTVFLEKTLMLGRIEGRRRGQRMRWLDSITDSMDMSLSNLRVMVVSLIAQLVKNLPEMQETPVQFLGREDLLKKG